MMRNFCRMVSSVSRAGGLARTSVKTQSCGQCQVMPLRLMSANQTVVSQAEHSHMLQQHKPSNLQKRILVWNKNYPSVAEVPDYVSPSEVKRANDWLRIRVNIWMMIAGALGCLAMAIKAKSERNAGQSIKKQNLKWHEEYNKTH